MSIRLKSASETPKPDSITWEGRRVPLVWNNGVWRMRAKNRWLDVDVTLGTPHLPTAKREARRLLEDGRVIRTGQRPKGMLGELVRLYDEAPKKTKAQVGRNNISRLRTIVRTVHGLELDAAPVSLITPEFWAAYQKKAAPDGKLDYQRRHPANVAINSAVRAARSIFIRRLRPVYERAGLRLAADCDVVTWLAEPAMPPPAADDAGMIDAWRTLDDLPLWFCVGLARFAGLRREEVMACRGSWIRADGDSVFIDLHDRPDEGFWTKTGAIYSAAVIDPTFAAALRSVPAERLVVNPETTDRPRWVQGHVLPWLRPFTGKARMPLHRLRKLYASQLARETEIAVRARLESIAAAQRALGHTTSATTERHYLG